MESFRSAVQPRNGSSPPVNALQARSSFCSALQPRSGSSPPINWLPHRLRVFSAVQLRSGPSRPVSSLRFRKSACSAVHLRSGSSPPDSWLLNRSSTCSAGSLSSGNGPCSPQPSNRSERSAALHTAASPKIDAHLEQRAARTQQLRDHALRHRRGQRCAPHVDRAHAPLPRLLHHRCRQLTLVQQPDAPWTMSGRDGEALHTYERLQPVELLERALGAREPFHRLEPGHAIAGVAVIRQRVQHRSVQRSTRAFPCKFAKTAKTAGAAYFPGSYRHKNRTRPFDQLVPLNALAPQDQSITKSIRRV
eukprot:scaffold112665_cov69-Phaeocystis_antarctica.AAC.3